MHVRTSGHRSMLPPFEETNNGYMASVAMTICMYVCMYVRTALVAHEVEGSTEDSCTKCPLYTECIHPLNLLMAPYIEEVFIGVGWSGLLALGDRVIVLCRHAAFVQLTGVGRAGQMTAHSIQTGFASESFIKPQLSDLCTTSMKEAS